MELQRTVEQWRECDPKAMARMSEAAVMYALQDAKADVLRMHAEVERLRADEKRLDWLADPKNTIGNVQLPANVIFDNPHSLRSAIDAAMELTPNVAIQGPRSGPAGMES